MRPTYSYEDQGDEAFYGGKSQRDNPYVERSMNWLQWMRGYIKAELEANGNDDSPEYDDGQAFLYDVERWLRTLRFKLVEDLPSVEIVAERIGTPLDKWPGNCHGIAELLLGSGLLNEHQEKYGRLFQTHGLYVGPIARDGHFGGRPITQHAWVESPNGHVVDATRWVFSNTSPQLWSDDITDYDFSGARFRHRANPKPPERDEGNLVALTLNDKDSLAVFDKLMDSGRTVRESGKIDKLQLRWIANLPLEKLGNDTALVYRTLGGLGMRGLVPIDCMKWYEDVSGLANESTTAPSM